MDEQKAIEILKSVEAIITDSHFVYTQGNHGTAYVNKDAVYPYPMKTSRLCRLIAEQFADNNVEVVIAPAVGGVKLSDRVAEHLTELTGREVLAVYAEKEKVVIPDPEGLGRKCFAETGKFVVNRNYDKLVAGKNVLVVEDILNTGDSAKKVIEVTRAIGGNVIGLGVLYNRGEVTVQDVGDVPKLDALVSMTLDTLDEDECKRSGPCSKGIPINTDLGKGREFLAKKSA